MKFYDLSAIGNVDGIWHATNDAIRISTIYVTNEYGNDYTVISSASKSDASPENAS
jgi:hypothetical protein